MRSINSVVVPMQYLREPEAIRRAIAALSRTEIVWLDTEVADCMTRQPRLSLIQAFTGETQGALVLDVLDRGDLIEEFIERVMVDAAIEKVFHNASFDKRFLGKTRAKNVTCTLQMARKIPKHVLAVPDRKLATLVRAFCPESAIDKTEQRSDWGRRPLAASQLHYAAMDAVYLEQVYRGLLARSQPVSFSTGAKTKPNLAPDTAPDPATDNVAALIQRYRQIEGQWQQLDREIEEIKERLKAAMQAQAIAERDGFQLTQQQRVTQKVSVAELGRLLQESDRPVDFQISLTKAQREALGELLERLTLSEQTTQVVRLKVRELNS